MEIPVEIIAVVCFIAGAHLDTHVAKAFDALKGIATGITEDPAK